MNAPTLKGPKVSIPKIAGLSRPSSISATTSVYISAPDYILGLDMSLEHTGWCLSNLNTGDTRHGVFEPNPIKSKKVVPILGMKRLAWLRQHVMHLAQFGLMVDETALLSRRIKCLVLIEGYAFGAKGSAGISLGELGGVIRMAMHDEQIPYIEIPPTQAKKFLTGKGTAMKDIVLKEVFKRYDFDTNDNNVADAYCLMQLGRAITNKHELALLAQQKEVVADVVNTYFKSHPELCKAAA